MWFFRLESRGARWLTLGIVLAAFGALAWSVIKVGLADWRGRDATDTALIERVAAWDPDNPLARTRIGLVLAESGNPDDLRQAQGHLEAALAMWPSHGFAWFHLGQVLDRQGQRARARQAAATALRYDPHNVALRWALATLLLQWGDKAPATEHLRYILAIDPGQRHVAFQLLRYLAEPGESVDKLLPQEADALSNILHAGLRQGDVSLARAAWERRVQLAPPLSDGINKVYLGLLLDSGDGEAARHAWSLVAPNGEPPSAGNGVWNGGFEGDPLVGWGLGWRSSRVWGVQVQVDRTVAARGNQSLRLVFNSFPNLEFRGVSQNVSVRPGQWYRLEALVRATDFTTRSGLKLQVVIPGDERVIAETGSVSGTTSGWVQLSARVDIPRNVSLVKVVLVREKTNEPEGNLGGKVWVDEIALVPLREAA